MADNEVNSNRDQPEPFAMRVPMGARMLGISEAAMWRLVGRGEIKTIRVGGCRLIPTENLREYVRSKMAAA